MNWYLEAMEQLLCEEDKANLRAVYAPRVVAVQPTESYNHSCIMPDGEIRLYGHTIGRGKGIANGGSGYLYSRDCGLSWHPAYADSRAMGPCVYHPQSDTWLHLGTPDRRLDASYCCISKIGPDDPSPHVIHWTGEHFGCPKIPFLLHDKPGRWVSTCHRDITLPDGSDNFSPVFIYSDDDGEHWTAVDLPVQDNSEWFYPDKGARWKNQGSEPTVTELTDGSLLLLTRTSDCYPRVYRSFDHGESWSGGDLFDLHASQTTSVLHRLSDGRTLLLWNNTLCMPEHNHYYDFPMTHHGHVNGSFEDAFTNRDVCHAAISTDGVHWVGQRELLLGAVRDHADYRRVGGRHNIGDQSLQQFEIWELPYGKILALCGQNISTRRVVLFDPKWLEETAREEDFQNGLQNVTSFQYTKSLCGSWFGHCAWNRTTGAAMMPDPEQGLRDVAQLCRYHDSRLYNEKQGLVWNFPAAKQGEITIQLRIDGAGLGVSLSDCWMNPSDPTMCERAPFYFTLEQSDIGTGWQTVIFRFDTTGEVSISLQQPEGERLLFYAASRRVIAQGLSYLHLQSLAEKEDFRGSYIRLLREEAIAHTERKDVE